MLFCGRMTKGYILSTPTISAGINSNSERNMWEAGTPISPQTLTFQSALEALTLLLLLPLFAVALHLSCMTEWNRCIIHPLNVGQSKLYWEMLEATKLSEDGRLRNSKCPAILVTFHAQNVPEFFCFMFYVEPESSISFNLDISSTPQIYCKCETYTYVFAKVKWSNLFTFVIWLYIIRNSRYVEQHFIQFSWKSPWNILILCISILMYMYYNL